MERVAIRVFDVLTEEEKERLAAYKNAIYEARTPLGIHFNKGRAEKLLANARSRYTASR